MAAVVFLVLVGVHLTHPERVPDVGLVPEVRMQDALDRVSGDVGRR